ncbi:hypothetical protein KR018_011544, partial [Drosophila ironensis]
VRKIKPLWILVMSIHFFVAGLFYILVNIKASSTYMRPKRQMWPVDHPAIVLYRQHPNAMRKFYWYNTRAPILVGKMRLKNYMRNMHMLPRYIPSPVMYQEAFANSKRSIYRDINQIQGYKTTLPPATTVDYVAPKVKTMDYIPSPVSQPVDFKIAPINAFVPLTTNTISNAERLVGDNKRWNYSESSSQSWTKCPERIINLAGQTVADCYKNTFPDYPKDQYSSQSVPSEVPVTTTNLPYMNYVAHTYFTLDDVILPRSANKFAEVPSGTSTKYESEFRPSPMITTVIPPEAFTERYRHTTQMIPTTTEAPVTSKSTFFDMDYRSFPYFPSSTAVTTTTTSLSTLFDLTTAAPTFKSNYIKKNITQSYKNRLKSLKPSGNSSSNIETKLKLLKLHLKNLVTTTETPKLSQNVTKSAVGESNTTLPHDSEPVSTTAATRRLNTNRKLRKFRVLASTRKIPVKKSTNSTESNKIRLEHKKPKRIYERRKHFNSTVSPEVSKNTTTEEPIKFKRRTTTRKSQTLEEHASIRNSTKSVSNHMVKSRSDRILDEKSSQVTESAIMTITSGNIRMRQPTSKLKSKSQSARKIKLPENDNFIPSLPIEVYFKKVNQQ